MKRTKTYYIFDIETDGLLHELSKIHCVSYQRYQDGELSEVISLTSYEEMRNFFQRDAVFVAHNGVGFDNVVVKRILEVKIENFIDTLGLSWYLYPNIKSHGLESWGEYFGVPKPEIKDGEWKGPLEGESQEDFINKMVHRCEEDVKINVKVFLQLMNYLQEIYETSENVARICGYTNFKMECLRDQVLEGITLDKEACKRHLKNATEEFNTKTKLLQEIMPKELGVIAKEIPKRPYKKDGTLSYYGDKWFDYLREHNLPFDTKVVRELPNPGSNPQLKKWLYSLGWKPITFKESKSTGKMLSQVSLPFGQGLCPSVKELYEKEPQLVELENYYMLKHRIGLFKSFLANERNGKVASSAHGFTNTMRLTHSKPIANLPKPSNPWGKEIRECLTVPNEDYLMCGSDVSSLEDNTKQHFIYFYDPEYVRDMRVPGFDPHLDIGVLAGLISKSEEEFYKKEKNNEEMSGELLSKFKKIDKLRGTAKSTNFAATYGAGGPKIAEVAKLPLEEGYKLHKVYWERNSAILDVERDCTVKTVRGQKWLYNPISGFWMFLKAEKDRFSTLNQSSGVYVFDTWLRRVRQKLREIGAVVVMQYHDELLIVFKRQFKDYVRESLFKAMAETNEQIKLNVTIGISVDFGNNYADCH